MKNRIYMMSLAVLAMVSCVNDDIVQINNGMEISFRSALDTRATELTESNLSDFYVTALTTDTGAANYFTNVQFTKETGSSSMVFTSEYKYYWPASGELDFYAYRPGATEMNAEITITPENKVLSGYAPVLDVDQQIDIVYAHTRASKANNAASVPLEFKHALSQVGIVAKNTNEAYDIKIKAIRLKNVAGEGDFYLGTGSWITDGTSVSYEITRTDAETAVTLGAELVSLMSEAGNAMLIPQKTIAWAPEDEQGVVEDDDLIENQNEAEGEVDENEDETIPETDPNGSYIAFLIQVNAADGMRIFPTEENVDYAWVAKSLAFNWVAGYKYIYTCDFSKGIGVAAPDNDEIGGVDTPTGEEIFGSKIAVDVSWDNWTTTYGLDVPM